MWHVSPAIIAITSIIAIFIAITAIIAIVTIIAIFIAIIVRAALRRAFAHCRTIIATRRSRLFRSFYILIINHLFNHLNMTIVQVFWL